MISGDEICADARQLRMNVLFGTKKVPAVGKRAFSDPNLIPLPPCRWSRAAYKFPS